MSNHVNKERIRVHLRTSHSDADLKTWFDPLNLRFHESGILEVGFPHALFSTWFDKERRKTFEQEINKLLGATPRIVYSQPKDTSTKRSFPIMSAYQERLPKQKFFQEYADGRWSFETFIYNQKNEFVVSMARETAMQPQNPPHVPFIISGRGTCGKTHILRAITLEMIKLLPVGAIFAGTVPELNAYYQDSSGSVSFNRKLLRKKAILIDNAQEFSKYPDLQQMIVPVIDSFKDKNKPFVLTVDSDINYDLLSRQLVSRLSGGFIVTLKEPDLDIRLRYVKNQCSTMSLRLKKEFILQIVQQFQNLRVIQGALAKIAAYEKRSGRSVSGPELQKILAGSSALSPTRATPSAIIMHVAEAYGLTAQEILGDSRRSDIVFARQASMYLCRQLLGTPLSSLGKFFNGKNHATVIYACKKIEKIMDSDKDTHNFITQIRKKYLATA